MGRKRIERQGEQMAENGRNWPGSLTPRQQRFVEALLESAGVAEAARRAGIGERTARRYLKQPGVQAAILEAQQARVEALSRELQQIAGESLAVLRQALQDKSAHWSARLRAVNIALTQLLRVMELVDLERRVQMPDAQERPFAHLSDAELYRIIRESGEGDLGGDDDESDGGPY